MTTATPAKPTKPARKKTSSPEIINRLRGELDAVHAELHQVKVFFEEIQKFSQLVLVSKIELKKLNHHEADLKEELADVRSEIRTTKDLIESCNNGMLTIIEPGPDEFLPLFDRMAKADPETHGKGSDHWRERPIGVLRLSPMASNCLIDAGIVFIGQLQDMILADPTQWWEDTAGLTF